MRIVVVVAVDVKVSDENVLAARHVCITPVTWIGANTLRGVQRAQFVGLEPLHVVLTLTSNITK